MDQPIVQGLLTFLGGAVVAGFNALLYMASRMEIIAVSRCVFHARQVIRHGAAGKVTDSLIGRAGIQGVRSMGENFFNPMFFCK